MLKAHSLLYAVYVCLIVSIICGALLYFATLYSQLNLFYNTNESLFIHNQSSVNYAIGSTSNNSEIVLDEETGIQSSFQKKQYGLLSVLLTHTFVKNDTIDSAFFVGQFTPNKTALYLSNLSQRIAASGSVTINGDMFLPTTSISDKYIDNSPIKISITGNRSISEMQLPKINEKCKEIFQSRKTKTIFLNGIQKKNDSIYVNSFFNETLEIQLTSPVLSNVIIKGNFVISAKDSIVVTKNTILEDVILIAPKVIISDGFNGNIQVFANENIRVGKQVVLNYPSALCVYNKSENEGLITIDEESKIAGLVFLLSDDLLKFEKNKIETKEKSKILGTVYNCGTLYLKSDVLGSVYSYKISYKTNSSEYGNCIANVSIDATKRPKYFMELPLFEEKTSKYGIIKKVL